jgi:ABC-type nitrate/sulfonate/bicarbonate transport system substrate-binding protein
MRATLAHAIKIVALATVIAAAAMNGVRAQERTPFRMVFSAPPTTFQLPHYVAKDLGWFDRAGLKVEESYVAGDSNAVRGLVSGGADAASTGLLVGFQAVTEGARIKVAGSWQPKVDYQMLVQDSIKSLRDLATARIGTASAGGLTQRIPEMLMQKHGVNTNQASFVSLGGHEARMKAVVAGKVDASVVGMLYAARARGSKGVRVLSSVVDDFPALGFTFLIVADKDLTVPAKRQAIETYVRWGIIEGSRFIMKDPDRAAEIMRARDPETPLELIREIIREMNRLNLWGVNGGLEAEVIDFNVKLGADMGVLKRPMAPGEGVDRSLVDKALAEAGRV